MKTLDTHLRTHRRQWGFSQRELSFLLGLKDRSLLSLLERAERNPNLKTAFGCEALFGVSAKELFPKFYANIQDDLMRRAYVLHERLKREDSPEAESKSALLEDALKRAKELSRELKV